MRILGVDPGSVVTGYGIVEQRGSRLREVESGVIRPGPSLSFLTRLSLIHDQMARLLERLRPDEVAVENPFLHRNVRTLLQLGQARAAALLPAVRAGLSVYEYAPRQVKQAVVGSGAAEKHQVARMVALLLGRAVAPAPLDATDALAVAICHAHQSAGLRRIERSSE